MNRPILPQKVLLAAHDPPQESLMYTPWGVAQTRKTLAPGIIEVETAGHGGIHLDPELNQQVPDYMRSPDGWYEEDVDWAIVTTIFPEIFTAKDREAAKKTMKNAMPDAYETFYQEVIPPGESYVKDERAFRAVHKNDYISLAAFGDWHPNVPKGYVVVHAGRGGRTEDYQLPKDRAYFLVAEEEYEERGPFGFVIDEARHERVDFE